MRISDWSSNVCTSDLVAPVRRVAGVLEPDPADLAAGEENEFFGKIGYPDRFAHVEMEDFHDFGGPEELRVGYDCDSMCRARWSLYHPNNNTHPPPTHPTPTTHNPPTTTPPPPH